MSVFLIHHCSLGGGNLQSYLADHFVLTELEASRFLRKIIEGLQYLHEDGIIHVNLKVIITVMLHMFNLRHVCLIGKKNDIACSDYPVFHPPA